MNRDFQLNTEAEGLRIFKYAQAVAECFIDCWRFFEKKIWNYKGKNADMSSDK